mmetsp:Transcript_35363/g.101694  ORF Transcript_35363/g.101694 Transcript_35363/m.101694 type:complete len:267 (-) Transcript_35363:262-1062(-)
MSCGHIWRKTTWCLSTARTYAYMRPGAAPSLDPTGTWTTSIRHTRSIFGYRLCKLVPLPQCGPSPRRGRATFTHSKSTTAKLCAFTATSACITHWTTRLTPPGCRSTSGSCAFGISGARASRVPDRRLESAGQCTAITTSWARMVQSSRGLGTLWRLYYKCPKTQVKALSLAPWGTCSETWARAGENDPPLASISSAVSRSTETGAPPARSVHAVAGSPTGASSRSNWSTRLRKARRRLGWPRTPTRLTLGAWAAWSAMMRVGTDC